MAASRPMLSDAAVLHALDEFLYHGETNDLAKAQQSFARISSSLGTEDVDALIPPCLEVLEFSNQFIRVDTLLCLMHISLGCSLGDLPAPRLAGAMRRSAAALARHDAVPMLVRSLDLLLGQDASRLQAEDGMVESEFRLIFNCLYIQVLFFGHDDAFVRGLEIGQGRLGAPLVSLLFEGVKACADTDLLPIKKLVLLLLRVLQCLLCFPNDQLLPQARPTGFRCHGVDAPQPDSGLPAVKEFHAFVALCLHGSNMRQQYCGRGYPAAIAEGLEIIEGYKEGFLRSYAFHPSELTFMRGSPLLQGAHARFRELEMQGLAAPRRGAAAAAIPSRLNGVEAPAVREALAALGTFGSAAGTGANALGAEAPVRARAGEPAAAEDRDARSEPDLSSLSDIESLASDSSASTRGSDGGPAAYPSSASSASEDSAVSAGTVIFAPGGAPEGPEDPEDPGGTDRFARAHGGVPARNGGASGPDGPDPRDRSPAAAFQRLYLAMCPRLTEIVVLLLRLLLTSCSNVESYPGVLDMSRERLATTLPSSAGRTAAAEGESAPAATPGGAGAARAPGGPATAETGGPGEAPEQGAPGEGMESRRQREIMAAAVSGVLLILLKQARSAAPEQLSSLAQLLVDLRGALVVLKFLNQDLSGAMGPSTAPPVLSSLKDASAAGFETPPSWLACATFRLLGVLYILCKDTPERVRKYLVHYKAPFILKRLHRIENDQMQRLVLKLLKKQVRYLPRKWKQANMKAISAIYSLVPMAPLEDWLLNERLVDVALEGPTQTDIRLANIEYNTTLLRHAPAAGGLAAPAPGDTAGAAAAAAAQVSLPGDPGGEEGAGLVGSAVAGAPTSAAAGAAAAAGVGAGLGGDAAPGAAGGCDAPTLAPADAGEDFGALAAAWVAARGYARAYPELAQARSR